MDGNAGEVLSWACACAAGDLGGATVLAEFEGAGRSDALQHDGRGAEPLGQWQRRDGGRATG